jgi:hypothetical protein
MVGKGGLPPPGLDGIQRAGASRPSQPRDYLAVVFLSTFVAIGG